MMQTLADFHDAELAAIEIDRQSKSIKMRFASGDTEGELIADSVSHFKASDVVTQNVVSRILASSSGELSAQDVEDRIRWVTTLSDGSAFANDQEISEIARRISAREAVLLAIEPSWGAEIVIIAKSVTST